MNESRSTTQEIQNAGNLCEDPETKGFDLEAGQSWIYPTNYPVRNYQFNIIQEALYKNTLVSLPTGLGKTFIAAVIMYNFYRWYPRGKVIFMAPTRPLVEQQINACYNIMAIPQEVTAELTGAKKAQSSRDEVWESKRVFFITPQVLQNDLERVLELGNKIKCLVFDEAHKAKGNYAYCEVIRRLLPRNKLFRVLALSATPGNSLEGIAEVMQNLLITHLEFRNEESADVKEYVFQRSLETVVVPLGDKLQQVKENYEQVLEGYARTLIKYKVVYGNVTNLTKGKIHMVKKEFQARNRGSGTPYYAEIMKTLNICVTLYHGYEALIRCGLRIFLSYFEEHINNPLLRANTALTEIIEDLRDYLGPSPEVQCLPDGSFAPIPASTRFGHPKFYRLRDILLSHFSNCDESSRVIVFFEYKESVKEAHTILCQNYPTIKPRVFVGQGSGVKQKDQIHTIRAFRTGSCNTLLSTCIGEEGLDVGEVDLIVCFDTTNKSPIRMIQRMGRTGRKKEGKIVILVTEGKEQQTVKDSLMCKSNLDLVMTNSTYLEAAKYKANPLMIPSYIKPKCQKLFITVKKPVLTKNSSIKDIFRSMSSDGPRFFSDVEVVEIKERIKSKADSFWDKEDPLSHDFQESQLHFCKHLEKQRVFQACDDVKPSKQTEIFVHLLQFADSKRYNIPVTQPSSHFRNKLMKQSDIRSMFTKNNKANDISEVPCSLSSVISNYEKEKELFPEELFREITDYLLIQMTADEDCRTCTNLFKCPKFYYNETKSIDLSSWVQPDLSISDTITAKDLQVFADSLSPQSNKLYQALDSDDDIFNNVCFTQFEELAAEPEEKSFAYETPKSFAKIVNSFKFCENSQHEKPTTSKSSFFVVPEITSKKLPEHVVEKKEKPEDILGFFKLSSLEDLFTDDVHNKSQDSDRTLVYTPKVVSIVSSNSSPDLFPSSEKKEFPNIEEPQSPILCSYNKEEKTVKVKKQLFEGNENDDLIKKPNLSKLKLPHTSFYESKRTTPNKTNDLQVELKSLDLDISDLCDLSEFGINSNILSKNENKIEEDKSPSQTIDLDISDLCDLSIFGLGTSQTVQRSEENKINLANEEKESDLKAKTALTVDDICDIDDFFNTAAPKVSKAQTQIKSKVEVATTNKKDKVLDVIQNEEKSSNKGPEQQTTGRKLSVDDICDIDDFFNTPTSTTIKTQREIKSKMEIANTHIKEKTSTKTLNNGKNVNERYENQKPEQKITGRTLSVDDVCDIDDFFNTPIMEQSRIQISPQSEVADTSKIDEMSDIDDFCDISSFLNADDEKTKKDGMGREPKKNITEKVSTIKKLQTPSSKINSVINSANEVSGKLENKKESKEVDIQNDQIQEDLSYFASMAHTWTAQESKNKESEVIVIDLTDDDLEEPKSAHITNKAMTQLSITQMLSLMSKSENKTHTQKENSTCRSPKTKKTAQKSILSLNNNRKGLSLKNNNNKMENQIKQTLHSPKTTQLPKMSSTPRTKSKYNISLSFDSDDEFEDCKRSPIFVKPKPVSSAVRQQKKPVSKEKKTKKLFSDFIEEEAVVSDDDVPVSEDEEESDDDCFESSFVNDETQDFMNTTNMHAHYLKTTKSPTVRGKFKIPDRPKYNVSNVFSQEVSYADETYLNDSFVVNSQDVDPTQHELSELEILEEKLKRMKKNKKRKSQEQSAINSKKRRIIVISDDSD